MSKVTALRGPADLDAASGETAELWQLLREEAAAQVRREPILGAFLRGAILDRETFADALACYLGEKLADREVSAATLARIVHEGLAADPTIVENAVADLRASRERNPAYADHVTPFLYFKGYQALQWHRVGHALWRAGRRELATYLQSRVSEVFGVDIHPAARMGRGIFIDHATGVVIGETAVVEDDVSILHGVTLGGTGKEPGDRHPKIGRGVLIGAGASILGNIRVGDGAKIGAGSVVLRPVPPHATAAGVPARVVAARSDDAIPPALSMDQELPDFMI